MRDPRSIQSVGHVMLLDNAFCGVLPESAYAEMNWPGWLSNDSTSMAIRLNDKLNKQLRGRCLLAGTVSYQF